MNAVTGKPAGSEHYEAATVAHCETVLRGFYDFHLEAGTGPMVNLFPLSRHRSGGRAHAHHNPMEPFAGQRRGRYRPKRVSRALRCIPDERSTVFVAEIGDVHRFTDPAHLCSWAGLTPRHRESDTVVHRGHLTKQGSKAVRWAAIEAVQRHPTTAKISADKHRIEARRGTNIATVAAARKLLTLVYYGLRDGHIRALDRARAA